MCDFDGELFIFILMLFVNVFFVIVEYFFFVIFCDEVCVMWKECNGWKVEVNSIKLCSVEL